MPTDFATPTGTTSATLLADVLAVSLTPLALLRPLRDEQAQVLDFAIDYLNPAAAQLLHLPERPSATFLQVFPAEPANGGFAFFREALASEAEVRGEFGVLPGSTRRVRVAARRSGELLVVSFSSDPSAQQADEEEQAGQAREAAALAEASRQRLQLFRVLDHAPALICLLAGPSHVVQFVNPLFQALAQGRQLLGLPLAEAAPTLLGQPALALLDEAYRSGQSQRGSELPVQVAAGAAERYFEFLFQPRPDASGQVGSVLVFAYEVSGQVQARRQLEALNAELESRVAERTQQALAAQEQQRAQLYQLFMQTPGIICVLDGPQLVYELVNPAYQQIFPDRQLLGLPLFEALPELLGSSIPAIIAACYLTGEPYVTREQHIKLRRTQGGPLESTYWNFTFQPRRNGHDEVDGIINFAYEVTPQVEARQYVETSQHQTQALANQLHLSNQQLQRTNVDLDNFIYVASHDLRAPISNLEGLLLALRQELRLPPAEAVVDKVLNLMQDSIQRFQRTISYLTDVSQLQQNVHQPVEQLSLASLIESVRLDLAPLLASTGGQLQLHLDSCPPVTFGEKNLRSIVYNLLSNALKYRAPTRPPMVQVHCRVQTDYVVLEVRDNGLGLSESQQLRLFGMFQRLHDHVDGSGIGLYMVRRIVNNAGGYIEVESQVDVGTTFRVVLPVVPATGSGNE